VLPLWASLLLVLVPGSIKALRTLFVNYQSPDKLIAAQGFTIQFQMFSTLIIIGGLLIGKWISF
jgi:hypothetical protein